MRILQICSARSIGGGERHVIDLSNELSRRGHQVFVALPEHSPVQKQLVDIPTDNIAVLPLRNALDLPTAAQLARFARRNSIDLMNAHLARDYPPVAAVSTLTGIPYVITRHVLFPMKRLHKAVLRGAQSVIAPSNAVAENLRSEGIFSVEKVVTIRYGLDVKSYGIRMPARDDTFVVGAVGNLDPVKGFDMLVRAAKKVVERVPHASFEIVGDDRSRDGRNKRELGQLIREQGLEQVIEMKGWSDDVRAEMARFDVFVSSSRSESFGFAIAEAMLSGVPVVATATDGAREIISDDSLGSLVPIDSEEELAAAIVDLANDAGRREALALGGPAHIARNFSVERMVDETEALYQRALAR